MNRYHVGMLVEICDHAGDPALEKVSILGWHGLVELLGLASVGITRVTESGKTKVSRGGTPGNGAW